MPASVSPILVWARSARRKRILTRAVAFGTSARTETVGECPLPFPIGLGALSGPRHIKTMHLIVCAVLVGVRHGFLLAVVLCKWIMPYSPLLPVFLLCLCLQLF